MDFCGILGGVGKIAKGAAWFPFIFIRSKEFDVDWLIIHERIHFRQQIETLYIGSTIIVLFEMLYAYFILKKTWWDAYLWCSNEQEAYLNMHDKDYLKNRKLWSRFHYIKNKKDFILTGPGQITFK